MAGVLAGALAGLTAQAHATFPGQNGQIAFSTGVAFANLDLFAINADGRFARPLAVRSGRDTEPVWSPDGRRFAWVNNATGRDQIRIADADGGSVRRFAAGDAYDADPSWSPDGRKLLFTSGRDGTGTTEIYVADTPDGTNVRRLTFRPLEDYGARWSPDGRQIVWFSRETANDKFHLYMMNADGSNQRRLLPNRTAPDSGPSWSPDGRRLLWTSYSNAYEIWVGNADGSGAHRIADHPNQTYSPVWSPDGKQIAFTQQPAKNKNFELVVARPDGGGQTSVIGISKFGYPLDWQSFAERGAQPSSLLRDGGTEDGFGGYFFGVDYPVPDWQTNGGLTALRYGLPGFPTAPGLPSVLEAARGAQKVIDRGGAGERFFFGGNSAVSTAVQDVSLGSRAQEIDTGQASATLSGLLGGKAAEADEGTVVATFLNAQGGPLGLVQLGPVTPAERRNQTTMVGKLQTAKIPVGTRRVRVTLTATRRVGNANDAYFDNLALVYTKPPEPAATPEATPQTPPTTPPTPVQPPPAVAPGVEAQAAVPGRISRLRLSRRSFAVGSGDTAVIAQRRRARPRGAKIRYRLSRATVVTIKFARERAGRRGAGGRCSPPTRANRKRKRCTRRTTVATILRSGRAGAGTVGFSGRVNRRALKPGRYRVTASAANSVSARFRIVRR